jgi:hypothetical protein
MATLQGKAVKNTYRQVLQIGANNVGVSGSAQRVQDGAGVNTALSLSTIAATIHGDLTITGDLIITGGGIQIQDLIDDTVATLIQNGTGITWAYNDGARTLTPTITIATADGGVQGDFMQLNTGAGEANAVAKIYWNSTEGTADLGLMGGQVILPIGQKQVARVLNNSGTTFTKAGYQVVKITAAQGQRLAVGLAQANNDANSTDTLGLVAENIANNQEGFITTSGLITNVDTTGDLQLEDWNDGDILYLSPTTPGAITKVKPIAPQHTIIVGFVVYAHQNNGKIFVKVDNGYELDELHNVRITAVADNNILQYNSSLAVWENVAGTTTNISEGTNLYYTQARFDSAFAAKTTTNLTEGANLYFTTARGDANFATNFATKTTTNLPEGTNLYYTNTRARAALSITAGTGIDYNSTTGVFALSAIPNASLTNSSITINSQSVALGASVTLTTTNIAEGTNLYWTDARFDTRFSTKTTTNLTEGTNLYYTQARFNTAFTAKSTTDLAEGTNLYYTDARARLALSSSATGLSYANNSGVFSLTAGYAIPTTVKLGQYDIAYNRSIVSAAVSGTTTKTLTLTEQDANTITATWTDLGITTINGTANQIAANTVGNTTTIGFTNDVTMPNNLIVSGNLTINGTATYVNTQSISAKDPLFEVANDNNSTDAVDIGYYGRFYDSAQTRVEFTGLFRDASDAGKFKFFTGLVDEPTNVVNTTGTGYTVGTLVANFEGNLAGTANAANVLSTARSISATGDAAWSVNFDGSANATAALTLANTGVTASTYGTTTSVPTIAIDGKGRITSASNTNIAFPVTTVNGASGTVVLTTTNIAEGTNQYFTSARAQAAISGTAPISVASGVVSISQSGTATNGYLSSTDWNTFNDKSPAVGSTSITTLGTIATGTWNGTSIGAAYGGTGIASYVVGDILYASGATTLSKLADVATGNALISGGVGVAPSWGKIDLTTTVSGILPVANGGTGSATQNFVDLTTTQSIGGAKTFTSALAGTSATFSGDLTVDTNTLFVDSTNNRVGIGTLSPAYTLDVSGTLRNTTSAYFATTSGVAVIGATSANAISKLSVRIDATHNIAFEAISPAGNKSIYIAPVDSGTHLISSNYLIGSPYLPLAISARENTSDLYLAINGNIGIGTSSPFAIAGLNLSLDNAASSAIQLGVAGVRNAQFYADGAEVRLYAVTNVPLKIGTNDTERMRITSTGRVGINQGSPGVQLSVGGQSDAWQFGVTTVQGTAGALIGSPSANVLAFGDWSGSEKMRISAAGVVTITNIGSGAVTATSGVLSATSDMNLKISDGYIDTALDKILKLTPRYFYWKEETGLPTDLRQLGFYAQEVNEAIGEEGANTPKTENDKWGIYDRAIIAMLTKAMQEQQAQIEELKAMIAAK